VDARATSCRLSATIRAMSRRQYGLVGAVVVAQLVAAAVAQSFAATRSAASVIGRMRAEARTLKAVRTQRTGALVYCPSVPEGWAYAPQAGCRLRARVSEEDDLSNGHVVRLVGHVTARGKPSLTYVVGPSGWYQSASGSGCWTLELRVFVAGLLVDYPLPDQRVSILNRTPARIVIEAISRPDAYKLLDYVNPRTFFDYRDVEIGYSGHRAFRVYDRNTPLRTQTPRPSTTPICGQPRARVSPPKVSRDGALEAGGAAWPRRARRRSAGFKWTGTTVTLGRPLPDVPRR
jgi:hypothetical protein